MRSPTSCFTATRCRRRKRQRRWCGDPSVVLRWRMVRPRPDYDAVAAMRGDGLTSLSRAALATIRGACDSSVRPIEYARKVWPDDPGANMILRAPSQAAIDRDAVLGRRACPDRGRLHRCADAAERGRGSPSALPSAFVRRQRETVRARRVHAARGFLWRRPTDPGAPGHVFGSGRGRACEVCRHHRAVARAVRQPER